ncbi:MAG: MFS transporter [Xanthobacteraceae bacterium]
MIAGSLAKRTQVSSEVMLGAGSRPSAPPAAPGGRHLAASLLCLLLALVLLNLGSGLLGVLIPIRGELAGFSILTIGGFGTSYYSGFVVGCLLLPALVSRFGHIRSFSAVAALAASAALLHAVTVAPLAWLVLRAAVGFCFAGLFMVIESWLNDQATSGTRGRVLGMYTAATWVGVVGGNLLFSLPSPDAFSLFALASIAISISLVPITLTTGAVPAIPEPASMSVVELYRTAPVGVVGCLAAGLANGAFWTFAPIFAQAHGNSSLEVSLFMAAVVIGGALSQWPIGRFSDRLDRRRIIVGACLVSAAAALLLMLQPDTVAPGLIGLGFVFGAFALSLYPVCVAHVNDRAHPKTFVKVSSHLLMAFGLGAIVGPLLAGVLISEAGISILFAFTATIHVALALFALSRIWMVKPVPDPERGTFAPLPPIGHATQPIFKLQEGAESDENL